MHIVATVCIFCADTNLNNISVTHIAVRYIAARLVPARYVRHIQMCPQLDVSDKNDQKTQDMSDKARFVRQK